MLQPCELRTCPGVRRHPAPGAQPACAMGTRPPGEEAHEGLLGSKPWRCFGAGSFPFPQRQLVPPQLVVVLDGVTATQFELPASSRGKNKENYTVLPLDGGFDPGRNNPKVTASCMGPAGPSPTPASPFLVGRTSSPIPLLKRYLQKRLEIEIPSRNATPPQLLNQLREAQREGRLGSIPMAALTWDGDAPACPSQPGACR